MNKLLTALLISAISVSAFASSQLVYDFKSSVKRLNPVVSTIKYSSDIMDSKNNTSKKLESYTIVNDTLNGYFLINNCSTCTADGWTEFNDDQNIAEIWLTRSGDKKKLAWIFTSVEFEGGVFGKGVGVRPTSDYLASKATSLKNIKSAWLNISFDSSTFGLNTLNHNYGTNFYPYYGLLGEDYQEVSFECSGFGKATGNSKTIIIDGGICGTPDSVTNSCVRIESITGNLVGTADIASPCCTPMWDSCALTLDPEADVESQINKVGINGTWSIKFNKKMTKTVNETEVDEEFILSKLNAKSATQTGFTTIDGEDWETDVVFADNEY